MTTPLDETTPAAEQPLAPRARKRFRNFKQPEETGVSGVTEGAVAGTNPFGEPVGTTRASAPANTEIEEAPPEEDLTPEDKRAEKYERLGLGTSKPIKAMRDEEDKSVAAWLRSLDADGAPIRVTVYRVEPKEVFDPATGQRKKVDGMIRRYDRPVDEDEIQKNHGGGSYQLRVTKRNARNQWDYLTARTIEISGDPLLNDSPRNVAPVASQQVSAPAPDNNAPVMVEMVRGLMAQANRPAPIQPPPPDISGQIRLAIAPYEQMMLAQQQQLAEARREAAEARKGDPAASSFQQKMLDKFVDQDSARLQAVRAQYESEIRVLKEQAVDNERRIRDQAERDKEHLHRAHEREISTIKSSSDLSATALQQSFNMQKTVLESEVRRLERELTELRTDVKDLRNKKEPSFKDQVSGLRDMKEMMSDVLGEDEKEEKSTITKVFEGLAGSDVVAGFAQRVMSGAGGAPPPEVVQQQQRAIQQQQQQRRRGPRLVRDKRNGQVYATDGQKAIPVHRKPPLAAPQPPPPPAAVVLDENGQPVPQPVVEPQQAAPPPVEVPIPYVDPESVKMATDYMTTAFANGKTEPGDFVTGVKMFVPPEIIATIRQMGVDDFLRRVGGLVDGHPLLTQAGRNWARKVGKLLVDE